MNWIDATDDIDRAKRLRAVFDGNNALEASDRRVLVQALSDFISSYHGGRQVVTQAEPSGHRPSFARIGEAIRGL